MPKKLELETLSDKAYLEIRKALMSGKFVPGDLLVIRTLAETYGISATPMRDALQRLVAEKSLEMLSNRTIVVPHLTAGTFLELRFIRTALEGLAAALAAPNMREKEIERLEALIAAMDDDIAANDPRSYLAHNKTIPLSALFARAKSPLLLQLIENLWTRWDRSSTAYSSRRPTFRTPTCITRRIVVAVRRRRSAPWCARSGAGHRGRGRRADAKVAQPRDCDLTRSTSQVGKATARHRARAVMDHEHSFSAAHARSALKGASFAW